MRPCATGSVAKIGFALSVFFCTNIIYRLCSSVATFYVIPVSGIKSIIVCTVCKYNISKHIILYFAFCLHPKLSVSFCDCYHRLCV